MTERGIYEVANQLQGYVGPDTEDRLATFLMREGKEAALLADEIVRLRARVAELEAKPVQFLRRPTKPKFEFNTEEEK